MQTADPHPQHQSDCRYSSPHVGTVKFCDNYKRTLRAQIQIFSSACSRSHGDATAKHQHRQPYFTQSASSQVEATLDRAQSSRSNKMRLYRASACCNCIDGTCLYSHGSTNGRRARLQMHELRAAVDEGGVAEQQGRHQP